MGTSTLQRKNKPGKFLAIPQISPSNPTMDAISENLEQLTGMRGSGGKKAVLWEDMNSLGFAKMNKNGVPSSTLPDNSGTGSGGNTNVVEPPTKPLNVKGYGGFGIITLTWDYPTYKGHAYANVYQSDTDNFSTAVQVGTATGDIFSFPQANATAKFYWLRFVNANDDIGPLNATAGIQISTQSEDFLKDLIKSELGDIDFVDHDSLVDFAHVDLLDRLDVLLAESALENSTTIDEQISEAKVDTATLRATVKNEYYTIVKSNEVMAAAIQTVKSEIEDPDGTSLGATVKNNYVTNVTFNQAQAQLKQELQSNIGSVSSTLTNDYYTKTKTDEAISQATTTLNSAIESAKDEANQSINAVSSNLTNNYLTKTETNQAISQASLHLSSEISTAKDEAIAAAATDASQKVDVVSANLTSNYLTKTQTNHAISQATQTLESSINGVSSTVTSLSKTVADNEKGYEALWGVKASAGDVTASIGLVAKSNGADYRNAYFYVKNADFKVSYNDGSSDQAVPVFGTMDNPKYGQPGQPRKILVIDTAWIKAASIKDLVVSNLVSDVIIAQSEIRSPVIKTPVINDVNAPFYVSSAGIVSMRGANVNGHINAISGALNNVVIHEDCTILGTLSAAKIIGDIVKAYDVNIPEQRWTLVPPGSDHLFLTLNFQSEPWDRQLSLPALYTGSQRTAGRVHLNGAYVDSQSWFGNIGDAMGMIGPKVITLAKNQPHEVKIYLRNLLSNKGTPMIRNQDAVYLTFKS